MRNHLIARDCTRCGAILHTNQDGGKYVCFYCRTALQAITDPCIFGATVPGTEPTRMDLLKCEAAQTQVDFLQPKVNELRSYLTYCCKEVLSVAQNNTRQTKECVNAFRASNIYHLVLNKMTELGL